jgi:hypothetical protein
MSRQVIQDHHHLQRRQLLWQGKGLLQSFLPSRPTLSPFFLRLLLAFGRRVFGDLLEMFFQPGMENGIWTFFDPFAYNASRFRMEKSE